MSTVQQNETQIIIGEFRPCQLPSYTIYSLATARHALVILYMMRLFSAAEVYFWRNIFMHSAVIITTYFFHLYI